MSSSPDKLPRAAARLMIAMLAIFALVSVYANVQRARRDKIDTVKVTFATPTPTPSPEPR